MCVFRSDRHISVQIIDDTTGKVLVSASSLSKEFREQGLKGSGVPAAKAVGALIAGKAVAQSIEKVVFDRCRLHLPRPGQGPGRRCARKRSEVLRQPGGGM